MPCNSVSFSSCLSIWLLAAKICWNKTSATTSPVYSCVWECLCCVMCKLVRIGLRINPEPIFSFPTQWATIPTIPYELMNYSLKLKSTNTSIFPYLLLCGLEVMYRACVLVVKEDEQIFVCYSKTMDTHQCWFRFTFYANSIVWGRISS